MAAAIDDQFVTFGLGKTVFAAPVALVREILDYQPASAVPNGPADLLGLTDVRGIGVPTLDLRIRLGMASATPTPLTRILVLDVPLESRLLSVGLIVDQVFEVASFDRTQIGAAPDIGVPWRSDYIAGVVRRPHGFVVLIDLAQLFAADNADGPFAIAQREHAMRV